MKIKKILADKSNYGSSRNTKDIRYIVLHFTANVTDKAKNNCKYFQRKNIKSSAHYFVDDNNIIQSVPDNYVAWSVGDKKYANCSETGGGTFHERCGNANSISVELCSTNGAFTSGTIQNAVILVQTLMKKYNIDINHVIRHFDVTGKLCPGYWVCSQENEMKFLDFKVRVLQPASINKSSPQWLVKWLQYHVGEEVTTSKDKIAVDGKYGAKTASCIVDMWNKWKWKPSSGNGVGKKTINRLLQ